MRSGHSVSSQARLGASRVGQTAGAFLEAGSRVGEFMQGVGLPSLLEHDGHRWPQKHEKEGVDGTAIPFCFASNLRRGILSKAMGKEHSPVQTETRDMYIAALKWMNANIGLKFHFIKRCDSMKGHKVKLSYTAKCAGSKVGQHSGLLWDSSSFQYAGTSAAEEQGTTGTSQELSFGARLVKNGNLYVAIHELFHLIGFSHVFVHEKTRRQAEITFDGARPSARGFKANCGPQTDAEGKVRVDILADGSPILYDCSSVMTVDIGGLCGVINFGNASNYTMLTTKDATDVGDLNLGGKKTIEGSPAARCMKLHGFKYRGEYVDKEPYAHWVTPQDVAAAKKIFGL